MSTGSKAADERIARIAAAAPEFTDEQFGVIKRLLKRNVQAIHPATKPVTAPALDNSTDQSGEPQSKARTARRAA